MAVLCVSKIFVLSFTIWITLFKDIKGQCVITDLTASAPSSSSRIQVSWSCSNANNEFQLTIGLMNRDQCQYLEETYDNEITTTDWISSTSYVVDDLYAYSTYKISVQSRRPLAEGSYEYGEVEEISATTGEAAPTGEPWGFSGWSIGANHACLGFQPVPCGFRNGNIEMYKYVLNVTNTSDISEVTFQPSTYGSLALSTCIRPLECLNLHVLQMAGITSAGIGQYFSWNFWTNLEVAESRATYSPSTRTFFVTWKSPIYLGCPDVEEYQWYTYSNEGKCSSGRTYATGTTTNTSISLPGKPYSTYQISLGVVSDLPKVFKTVQSSGDVTPQDAPESPPSNVRLVATPENHMTLTFVWDEIPCLERNGIILGYPWQLTKDDEEIVATGEVEETTVTITDLWSDIVYKFRVAARTSAGTSGFSEYVMDVTSGTVSSTEKIETTPSRRETTELQTTSPVDIKTSTGGCSMPPTNVLQIPSSANACSLTFAWDEISCQNGNLIVLGYSWEIVGLNEHGQDEGDHVITGEVEETGVTATHLSPNVEYKFRVASMTNYGTSAFSDYILVTTLELGPPVLAVPSADSNSITIRWHHPALSSCLITGYNIQYWEAGTPDKTVISRVTSDNLPGIGPFEYTLSGLQKNVEYYIQVQILSSAGESDWSEAISVVTREGIPGVPTEATLIEMKETSVTIQWSQPLFRNGNIYLYHIDYKAILRPYEQYFDVSSENLVSSFWDVTNDTETRYTYQINNLEPSTSYEIFISARTVAGSGDSVVLETYTKGYSGIQPPAEWTLGESSSTTIEIVFGEPSLDIKYVVSYKVGVRKHSMSNKHDAPDFERDPDAYIAAQFSKFDHSGSFIVGDGETYGGFQNKPLDKNQEYVIHIGAVSGIMENEVTVWTTNPIYASTVSGSTSEGFPLGGIVAGVIVAVIVFIAVILLAIMFFCKWRRDKSDDRTSEQGQVIHLDQVNTKDNQAFTEDDQGNYHHYEPTLLDQQYEIMSSRLEIAWKNIALSGNMLGKGEFGEVQLGRIKIGEKWIEAAIKTVKGDAPGNEKTLFKKEYETMSKIAPHPNVINIIGSCEHKGTLYVALEFAEFGDLRQYLRRSRQQISNRNFEHVISNLLPEQMLNFASGVAKGMKHLAASGIIHRDLAARNVLLGRKLTPKVADFGMSRTDNVYVKKTAQRVPVRWLSLESLTMNTYTSKSDVWSFGILLWEISTFGGTPYNDMETKMISYHLREGYRMPKPENCENDIYELMLQCWQANPQDRPTFREIVDILTGMESANRIYMSTLHYQNFRHAAINTDKDDN